MRRSREKPDTSWPSWRYGPYGESAIFQRESDVPFGWTKKVGEVYVPPANFSLDKEDLIRQLLDKGIKLNPTWGSAHMKRILDGDISPTR